MKILKCTKCNRKIPSDSLLCPYCGERFRETIIPPSLHLPPPINPDHGIVRKRIKVLIPIAVSVMILIIVVFILFIIKAQNMLDCDGLHISNDWELNVTSENNILVKGVVFNRDEYCAYYYAELEIISRDENGNDLNSYFLKLDDIDIQPDGRLEFSYLIEDPDPKSSFVYIKIIQSLGKSNR